MTVIDQEVRERAIRETSTSFALSAGAGSGKTSVLTSRVLQLLRDGVRPRRIAAITFTEKAAGELQARVRDALEARLPSEPALEAALAELPELTLSTIHAFCSGLLTAEALDAGWAPDTEVLPNVVQAPEVSAAYRRWEEGFRRRHPVAGLLVRQRVNDKTLREAALRLLSFRDLEPVVDGFAFDVPAAFAGLQEAQARVEEAAALCLAPDVDKLLAGNVELRRVLARAVSLEPAPAVLLAMSAPKGKRSGGRGADWSADGKPQFLEALERVEAWRDDQAARLHALVVTDLRAHFLPAVDSAKDAVAVADFDDLLFRAAAVLGRDDVRARLAERYDALLIDEVQDTDPIQAEVAALLTRVPSASGAWNDHPPRPGRLFAVGDPRQSIYRFRRADVETWLDLEALLARDGEALTLVQNFRSTPGLVEWINGTFAGRQGYQPQVAHRGAAALEPVVSVAVEPDDEADAVARYLLHLHEAQGVGWSEVMLLLPAWTKAASLQATLTRAGVPCVVEGGSSFFERDEVRVAVAALKALEEPSDEASTVLALRGLFGIDWEALARHRAAGGAWRYTVPDPPPGPVGQAFALLRELGRLRGRRSWVALLDELLDRTRAAATWAATRDGAARLANLDKLRAFLRQVEAASRSPGAALEALEALAKDEKDLSRVDLDSDAVRITSYFKAKGLEARVVLLCFASRNRQGVQAAVDRRTRRVALKVGDLVPRGWQTYEDQEKAAYDAERWRWMYVAATRARDQLVIVHHDKSNLVAEHLGAGLTEAASIDVATLPEVAWRDETFPGLDDAVDAWLSSPPGPEADPTSTWEAGRRGEVRAAKGASTRWRSVQEVASRERVPEAKSPVGKVGGRLVHDVMEALDLGRPLDALLLEVDPLVASLSAELGVDDDKAALCADIVRGMLRHPVLEQARQAPERWVEVPFSIQDGGRVVSGRMDLAFPRDASRRRWVVVDWKSDLPPRGTPGWRNYERQLGWYAKALLATVSPCEEVETVLVGPHPELGAGPSPAEVLAEVLPELAPGLQRLLDAGLPAPRVGADVGEPVVATVELAWDEARVALCVGQPAHEVAAVRALGWAVVTADPAGLTWADDALAEIAAHFRAEKST